MCAPELTTRTDSATVKLAPPPPSGADLYVDVSLAVIAAC